MPSKTQELSLLEKYRHFFPEGIVPLSMRPKSMGRLLNWGTTEIYRLLNSGQIRSHKHGKARQVDVLSALEFYDRRLAQGTTPKRLPHDPNRWMHRKRQAAPPSARKRGRPRPQRGGQEASTAT